MNEACELKAVVLRRNGPEVLICDLCTLRELMICLPNAPELHPGDRLRIYYSGPLGGENETTQIRREQIFRVTTW